jgi:predicted MFS family arabinose efflux permease
MDQAQGRQRSTVVVAASIGTFVESYDLALYGYLAVILPAFEAAEAPPRFPLGRMLRTAWRRVLIFVGFGAMVLVGSNLLAGYLPSYLARTAGLSATEVSVANIAAAVALGAGAVLGGHLIDRFPLRVVAVACAVGLIIAAVPGFLTLRQGTFAAAVAGETMWGVAIGTGPYVAAWLVDSTDNVTAPALYLTVLALGGLAVALFAIPRGAGERRLPPSAVEPARGFRAPEAAPDADGRSGRPRGLSAGVDQLRGPGTGAA